MKLLHTPLTEAIQYSRIFRSCLRDVKGATKCTARIIALAAPYVRAISRMETRSLQYAAAMLMDCKISLRYHR